MIGCCGFNLWQDVPAERFSKINLTVLIPEGEKCVDAIKKRKGFAICNYGGGGKGKWKESDTQYFIDLFRWYKGEERPNWQEIVPNVVLMPDRDKVGLEHSVEIYNSLVTAGYPKNKIRWYCCGLAKDWNNVPHAHGLDIADMFQEKPEMTVEDILRDLKTTEECPWLERYFNPTSIKGNGWRAVIDSWLDDEPMEMEWLVQDIIPLNSIAMLVSESGVGKSSLVSQLAVAVVSGSDFLGKQVKQGKVVYHTSDESESILKRRLKMQGLVSGLPYTSNFIPLIRNQDTGEKWSVKHLDVLETFFIEDKPTLFILDSVTTAIAEASGVEMVGEGINKEIGKVAELCRKHSVTLILIHHDKKGDVKLPGIV